MFQPNLFTLVLRHPDTVDCIVEGVDLNSITSIALGASPVAEVFICPAQRLDSTLHGQEIIDRSSNTCIATACVGGFLVTHCATKWGQEVYRALDCTARNERLAKAAARINDSKAKTKDTTLEADRAKERARAAVLDHSRDAALFVLEARARLAA